MHRMASAIPLKDRICRSSHFSGPLGRYHPLLTEVGWDETGMSKALCSNCWNRRAAEEYNVPQSTLHDRVSGKVAFESKSGPLRYLDSDEELELANFISAIGYSRSMKQVIDKK